MTDFAFVDESFAGCSDSYYLIKDVEGDGKEEIQEEKRMKLKITAFIPI